MKIRNRQWFRYLIAIGLLLVIIPSCRAEEPKHRSGSTVDEVLAIDDVDKKFLRILCEVDRGSLDLLKAVVKRDPGIVLEKNQYEQTLLFKAALFDSPECIRFLVKHGSDMEARDKYGGLPLCESAESSTGKSGVALLELGADPTACDVSPHDGRRGYSALDCAASRGHYDMVKLMLEKGAPIFDEDDRTRLSPLHHACKGYLARAYRDDPECKGNRKVIDLLVEHLGEGGINIVCTPYGDGETRIVPRGKADEYKATDTLAYIKEAYPEAFTFDAYAVPESEINGHLKRAKKPDGDAAEGESDESDQGDGASE